MEEARAMRDVVIVGAGLAGRSLATVLSNRGKDVLLVVIAIVGWNEGDSQQVSLVRRHAHVRLRARGVPRTQYACSASSAGLRRDGRPRRPGLPALHSTCCTP